MLLHIFQAFLFINTGTVWVLCAKNGTKDDQPPKPMFKVKEATFVDKRSQWLYCYDETARPPAKIWWEVWISPATTVPGVALAGEGADGNRTYSNVTFVMDKQVHQVFFTCNAKNNVGHRTKIINMRYDSRDYDRLRLKITIESWYDMLAQSQSDSLSVVDKVYYPMDQFGDFRDGYRDILVIMCHMTGRPNGTELELVYTDAIPNADVSDFTRRCDNMQYVAPNVVSCNVPGYEFILRFEWQCRAKQQSPSTKEDITYSKELRFIRVPSMIRIRFQYNSKWYGYDERGLKFYFRRGAVALIRCDAGYYHENISLTDPSALEKFARCISDHRCRTGSRTDIPFPHQYEFYIKGHKVLPRFAKQNGSTLTISDIPASLNDQEIICFVRPQNKSDIAAFGVGQRFFKIKVFTMPEMPKLLVTMVDGDNKSQIIRNPKIIELRRDGPVIELTCTLENFDPEVDKLTGRTPSLDWVKCKNYECNFAEADRGAPTSVSSMEKRLEGNKTIIRMQIQAFWDSGIFMCVAFRPYKNATGDNDMQLKSIPVKVLVPAKPGEGDLSDVKYARWNIERTATGDIEFDCSFLGFPFPKLEIRRREQNNRTVRLDSPKWIKEFEGEYFDSMSSCYYGSQLKYRLPKENVGSDRAKGLYVCSAENSLGKSEADYTWDG